ncbi:LysM peptidoglycan-binding domain-containing protein [Thiomicrorhabdus aquaedulcis]|uniref:LysM peptidoglycan-binding domain-containing protein n=1 Tax=Thiomicrorhabdus aquaedulcis TaxID=2211106 RepID=UPI0015626B2A|nr:LysM domain-containing protein [Thiomicrorhabdus aquaedulcis]
MQSKPPKLSSALVESTQSIKSTAKSPVSKVNTQQPAIKPSTAPVVVASASNKPAKTIKDKQYTVKVGDSLWNIAQAHSVSVQQITLYNKFTVNTPIKPGQVIRIPLEVSFYSLNSFFQA